MPAGRSRRFRAAAWCCVDGSLRTFPIKVCHYPGLERHPQHELAKRQMGWSLPDSQGFGGMVSFEIKGDAAVCLANAPLCGTSLSYALGRRRPSGSLGSSRSSGERPAWVAPRRGQRHAGSAHPPLHWPGTRRGPHRGPTAGADAQLAC
eukprot:scaffold585_cov237-Pinguiococcus_pyrenoidosus.AAC.10